jgi:pectin methylesterase-like acyl-CoA thioesterase
MMTTAAASDKKVRMFRQFSPKVLAIAGSVLLAGCARPQGWETAAAPTPGTAATTQANFMLPNRLFPSSGSRDVCVDAPLRISFNQPPALGVGRITVTDASDNSVVQIIDVGIRTAEQSIGGVPHFKYFPVIISGNEATIHLPNGSLSYNKTYCVTLDAGAFKSDLGASAGISKDAAWRFTTKAAPPAAGTSRQIVSADGSGDFCTVQGAIDSLPDGNTNRTTLFIRKGTYTELINFRAKHGLTITGEDRKKTVIAYANNAVFNPSSEQGYHRGVFRATACDGLVVSNLTIRNTTPRGGLQAETIILNGDLHSKAIIANVDLYSFQDTLQINGQAYVSNCYIEGDVDFMWGRGPCFFENCHCLATRRKAFYAQVRNTAVNHGFVYHHCIFDGTEGVGGAYLNRVAPAVYPCSEMVLLECELGKAVAPAGWQLDAAKGAATVPATAPDLHFWEYNSHDTTGNPVDTTRRLSVSRQLKLPGDAELITNYSRPSFVLGDNWEAQSDPNLVRQLQSDAGGAK